MRRIPVLRIVLVVLALVAGSAGCVVQPPAPGPDYRPPDQLTDDELDAKLAALAPTLAENFADPDVVSAIPPQYRAAIAEQIEQLGSGDGRRQFIPELRAATLAPRPVPPLEERASGAELGDGAGLGKVIFAPVPPRGTKDPTVAPPPSGTTNVSQGAGSGACGAPDGVGSIPAPSGVAPGQILTPSHDVFTRTSLGIAVGQPGPLSPAGQEPIPGEGPGITLRNRGVLGQEMLVRVNLDDPKNFGPRALIPLLSTRPIGGTQAQETYVNATAREVRIHCYAGDEGRPDRGYWEGWVLIPRTEPGFQLIAEVVENDWFFQNVSFDPTLSPAGPQYFAGADRSTIHAGPAPLTSAQSIPRAAGAFATTGPDATTFEPNVLTDTNGLATDDLESALRRLLRSKIQAAADDQVGSFAKGNYAAGIYIRSMSQLNTSLDLEYVGQNQFFAPPGEVAGRSGALRARVSIPGVQAGLTLWFLGVPCLGASMTLDVVGRADVWVRSAGAGDGLDAKIDPNIGLNRADFSLSSALDWLDPVCWGGYLLGPTAAYLTVPGAVESGISDAFGVDSDGKPGAVQKLLDGFDLNAILPTISVGTTNLRPVLTNLDNGWCGSFAQPSGCTGDQNLLGANGPEVVGDGTLVGSLGDALGASLTGRFRNVFRPTLQTKLEDMVTSHRDVNQRLAGLGALVDPAIVNLALRHLSQGSSTSRTTNGLLDVGGISIASAGLVVSVRPEVAPKVLGVPVDTTPVVCPDVCAPPAFPQPPSRTTVAVALPDLRVSVSTGGGSPIQLSLAGTTNAGLAFNPQRQRLGPVIDSPRIDVQVVGGCQANYASAYALSYNLCGRGKGGAGGTYTLTALLDWVANDLVLPLLTASLGEIDLPSLDGIVPGFSAGIKNIRFAQRGGYLAVYADLGPIPRVGIAISQEFGQPLLRFFPSNAIDVNLALPGTAFTWTVIDAATMQPVATSPYPFAPTSAVQAPLSAFTETNPSGLGPEKNLIARLTVTQANLAINAEATYRWTPPILQPPSCSVTPSPGFLKALRPQQFPVGNPATVLC